MSRMLVIKRCGSKSELLELLDKYPKIKRDSCSFSFIAEEKDITVTTYCAGYKPVVGGRRCSTLISKEGEDCFLKNKRCLLFDCTIRYPDTRID